MWGEGEKVPKLRLLSRDHGRDVSLWRTRVAGGGDKGDLVRDMVLSSKAEATWKMYAAWWEVYVTWCTCNQVEVVRGNLKRLKQEFEESVAALATEYAKGTMEVSAVVLQWCQQWCCGFVIMDGGMQRKVRLCQNC